MVRMGRGENQEAQDSKWRNIVTRRNALALLVIVLPGCKELW
jgi:hypothetical protein